VVLINPGINAGIVIISGTYLASAFPTAFPEGKGDDYYAKRIGVSLLAFQTIACIPSNRLAGRFLAFVTMISVGCLTAFCLTGFLVLVRIIPGKVNLDSLSSDHLFKGTVTNPGEWCSAFFMVMWAYDGFANLSSSLGELKNPEKNVARSTYMGIGVVSVLYMLANVAYMVVLPFDTLAQGDSNVAAEWAGQIFGNVGQTVISLLIFLCTASASFIALFSASRIAQATGESQLILFPRFFSSLNSKLKTPVNALIFNFLMAVVLLFGPQGDTFVR
jgi:amino acid transporter